MRLLGRAEELFKETGLTLDPAEEPERDAAIALCKAHLDSRAFDAEYAAGRDLDPNQFTPPNVRAAST